MSEEFDGLRKKPKKPTSMHLKCDTNDQMLDRKSLTEEDEEEEVSDSHARTDEFS